MNRLEILLEAWQEEPENPFNAYLLALEYQKSNPALAQEWFEKTLEKFPDYLPSYFTYAQYLVELGLEEQAAAWCLRGLRLAEEQGQSKTAREIQSFMDIHF